MVMGVKTFLEKMENLLKVDVLNRHELNKLPGKVVQYKVIIISGPKLLREIHLKTGCPHPKT